MVKRREGATSRPIHGYLIRHYRSAITHEIAPALLHTLYSKVWCLLGHVILAKLDLREPWPAKTVAGELLAVYDSIHSKGQVE